MPSLSYSFHLSTKSHSVSTTGKVLKVSRHNLRQYKSDHYDQEMINIIRGSETSILEDVKRVYHEEFDNALERYNKGKRADRVISDYLKHVSESRGDVACEIIIQIGDRDFWDDVRQKGWSIKKIREVMSPIFKSQLDELEKLVPELKIASAVEHYDESSPHMHVVGIPVATGYKKGLSKQVAKTKIFTPERLSHLQDQMREVANKDITFSNSLIFNNNGVDKWNIDLNGKRTGRNKDIPKESLDEYYRTRKEIEKLKSDIPEQARRLSEGEIRLKTIQTEKSSLENEISRLKTDKRLLQSDVYNLQSKKSRLLEVKKEIESFNAQKRDLDNEIKRLKTDKLLIEADVSILQIQKNNLDNDVREMDKEKIAALEIIKEAGNANEELELLNKQIQDKKDQVDILSKQAEEKLSFVDEELSPEFIRQMLDDSVTYNLVLGAVMHTCNQLKKLNYLTVSSDKAFSTIDKTNILDSLKEETHNFIEHVKKHITKMLIKRRKKHNKSR